MVAKRSIFVLLPTGSRVEAEQARAALGHPSRSLAMANALSHTAGQRLPGDVVVVGAGAPTAAVDASGVCYRVTSMADLAGLDLTKRPDEQGEAAPESKDSGADPGEAAAPLEPEVDLAGMSRVDLIQHAAQNWPGARQWATLSNDKLKDAIRELSQG